MRSIRSPFPTHEQPKDDQLDTTAAAAQPAGDEAEQVAPVVPLREYQQQLPAAPEVSRLGQLVEFIEGPLSDWIARDRPAHMASPLTFVRERWSPQWIPSDVRIVLWAWRVLLLVRALAYTAFYVPGMIIYLPELTTAAAVAYLRCRRSSPSSRARRRSNGSSSAERSPACPSAEIHYHPVMQPVLRSTWTRPRR